MSEVVIATAIAFVVGFLWGYRKPAGYCRMSTAERHGVNNRLSSGVINGIVLAGIAFIIAKVLLG